MEGNPKALLPILVFVVLYLGLGFTLEYAMGVEMGFSIIPVLLMFMIALVIACLQTKDTDEDGRLKIIARGIGDHNVITMVLILISAGVFSGIMGSSGAESMANLILTYIPMEYSVVAIFIICALVSLSMGTSCGTITVIAPIAVTLASTAGLNVPLYLATVIGGSMFGDNLSFVSDTTIAACKGQGCAMSDKFKQNFKIALAAAIATIVILLIITAKPSGIYPEVGSFDLLIIVPYLIVLIGGVMGFNVFTLLALGSIVGTVVLFATGNVTAEDYFPMIGSGIDGMLESSMVVVLVAAMCALIKHNGGFEALLFWIKNRIKGVRGALLGIGFLGGLMTFSTANSAVAILMSNPIAKEISQEYGISSKTTASILDIFGCVVMGILPYGAIILVAMSVIEPLGYTISAFEVIPYIFYPYLLLVAVLIFIFFVYRPERSIEAETEV